VPAMHDLVALFHKIYDVQGIITWGGLAALVLIIFAETGLLLGFFLPGDSLLVTAGIYCTSLEPGKPPLLSLPLVVLLPMVAAVLGDTVGYWIGVKSGPALFKREQSLLFSRKHLLQTKAFYERHGGKTIIMARFLPFVRTFAPVVAGIGQMDYKRFLSFNVFGGVGWVFSMTMLGFSLSKIFPHLGKQIDKVIIVIIFVSLLPAMISWLANRKKSATPTPAA
jgi:membrane-associated protein